MQSKIIELINHTPIKRWQVLVLQEECFSQDWEAQKASEILIQNKRHVRLKVMRDFHSDGKKWTGEVLLNLDTSLDDKELVRLMEESYEEALKNPWPWYPHEQPSSESGSSLESSLHKKPSLDAWLDPMAQAFFSGTESPADWKIKTSVELIETVYTDSQGRQFAHNGARCKIEAKSLYQKDQFQQGEYLPDRLTHFGRKLSDDFKLMENAEEWKDAFPDRVYLSGFLPAKVFSYLLRQLDGRSLYSGDSQLVKNGPVYQAAQGDKINLRALVRLYNSPYSRWFDEDGVVMHETELVKDHIVKNFTASKREAHFLALQLTGHLVNFSMGPGSLNQEALRETPYLEISTWEDFTLDEASGDFEALVPYALGASGLGTPRKAWTGLRLSGNLRHLLSSSRWSTSIGQYENYEGPELIAIPSSFLRKKDK